MKPEKKYIAVALFLLRKIIGRTFPNPPVVSLVVESDKKQKNSKIINFGYTNFGGRPHAEAEALKGINYKINCQYTLYSTLEPCCHEGREESCVSKILKSKINKVVYSLKDPDKRVNGMGDSLLKSQGVKVLGGVMKDETKKIYEGYIFNRMLDRPRVTLKIGCSLDSKIAFKPNQKNKITNNFSQKIVHVLRSESDAILVGANTVIIDNPKLNCRVDGLKKFSPMRVVLSKNPNFMINSYIFKNCLKNPTVLITQESNSKNIKKFLKKNVKLIMLKKQEYNLTNILHQLAKLNVFNLLVEGGGEIFTSFINENLVDEIIIFRSNYFIGSEGKNMFEKKYQTEDKWNDFLLVKTHQVGDNSLEILENKNKYQEKL